MMMAFALLMIQFVLLMACAQSTHIIAATRDTSCVVSREQLAAAVALVANLEAQLQEARQTVVAKGLEVGSCELGASTTASEHSKTAPRRTNGLDDFSCSSECGRVLRPHRFRSIYVNRPPVLSVYNPVQAVPSAVAHRSGSARLDEAELHRMLPRAAESDLRLLGAQHARGCHVQCNA